MSISQKAYDNIIWSDAADLKLSQGAQANYNGNIGVEPADCRKDLS